MRRILVVDHEPMALEVAQLSLELAGWSVPTAHDGLEAIELAAGAPTRSSWT